MSSSKKTKSAPKEGVVLRNWLESLIEFIGNGGLTYAAQRLGMTPSGLLKLIKRPNGFHEPTLNCVALLLENKSERYPDAEITETRRVGNYIFELKKVGEELVPTWRNPHPNEV